MSHQADDRNGEAGRKPAGTAQDVGSGRLSASPNLPVPLEGEILRPGVRSASRWDQASAAFITQVIASLQREETQRDRRILAPALASARYADRARPGRVPQKPYCRLLA
jgi:hypothetical protein